MSTKIRDIVEVNITRETARVTRAGYGVPLIMGPHYVSNERVLTYTDPADMLTAGFLATDALYLAALALMSQDLSPSSFKIGRKLEDVNEKQTVTFTGTPSAGTWTLTLGAQTTTGLAHDVAAGAVETALELLSNITSVTVTGSMAAGFVIEFDGADASTAFDTFVVDVSALTGVTAGTVTVNQEGSAVETWTVGINAVITADADWFGLAITSRTKQDIKDVAAVIEAAPLKMFICASADADILTSAVDDLASELQDLDYDWTSVFYLSSAATQYPDAAWLGARLPYNPGQATWKFASLDTITPDTLTATELSYLAAKSANWYETVGGANIVPSEAQMAGGEFIDVMRGSAWLEQSMAEDIYAVLISQAKVPFTNQGIGQIAGIVSNRLNIAESLDYQVIAPNTSVVNKPDIGDISAADKGNRILNGITFSGTLAGAIHKATINGRLSL